MADLSVILFDLDDTLFDHGTAVRAGVAAHRAAHGGAIAAADEASEFARWTALEEHHYHRYLGGELPFLDMRRERARGFVEPYGLDLTDDAAADDWFGRYVLEYRAAWVLHDDTLPLLDRLAGLRLGIITNAERAFQVDKLETTGILDRFEHIVASGEVGVVKPDARIFEHAARLFGVPTDSCMYVGDRLATDALGAIDAGMHGVWIDRPGRATDADRELAGSRGARVIRSLDELAAGERTL